jgi:hypothetical protein
VLMAIGSSLPFLVATAASLVFTPITAAGQVTTPAASQLTPYTNPDGSASAGVPSGWQVTRGQRTFIQMKGHRAKSFPWLPPSLPATELTNLASAPQTGWISPCRIPLPYRKS